MARLGQAVRKLQVSSLLQRVLICSDVGGLVSHFVVKYFGMIFGDKEGDFLIL